MNDLLCNGTCCVTGGEGGNVLGAQTEKMQYLLLYYLEGFKSLNPETIEQKNCKLSILN